MNKKLIVIEGFDRAGKDTLLDDLESFQNNNLYIYRNDLTGLPKYNKEQNNFIEWLNKFIDTQINQLNKLFNKYDIVIMTRLIISDEVYSTLFNREHTTIKYIKNLRKDVESFNYCILFDNYKEYVQRLKNIGDNDIQYNERDFEKINQLYKLKSQELPYSFNINYVFGNTNKIEVLNNFLQYINYDKR